MKNYFHNIRIFIASPGDVKTERKRVDRIVDEVNNLISNHLGIKYEVIKWEKNAISEMGRPQEVINQQLNLKDCDLFLGILWSRFGSPTGATNREGTKFESGTEEEFELAYQGWTENRKPKVMFFRCARKLDAKKLNISQYKKVMDFFDKFNFDSKHPGLIIEYGEYRDFDFKLRQALVTHAFRFNEDRDVLIRDNVDLNGYFKKLGFKKLFLPATNSKRDGLKKEILGKATSIKLVSHAGYSFISHFGNIFRGILEERLKDGCEVKIILTNPWSEIGALVATSSLNGKNLSKNIEKDSNGLIRFREPLHLIENSEWYQIKHRDSIAGYKELKRKFDNIELRISKYFILASVLIVDDECFVEPYLGLNMLDRQEKDMLTFELNFDSKSDLYNYMQNYFELVWTLSDEYVLYEKNINVYKHRLKDQN